MSRASELVDVAEKKWSKDVKTKWHPPEGLFANGSATDIADAVIGGHKTLVSAMGCINLYVNRAGDNLSQDRKDTFDKVKGIIARKM